MQGTYAPAVDTIPCSHFAVKPLELARDGKITPIQHLILCHLLDRGWQGVSQRDITRTFRVSKDTVFRAFKRFEQLGIGEHQ